MLSALLSYLLSNSTIVAILAGIVGAIGWGVRQRSAGASKERAKNLKEKNDALTQHYDDLARSANAGRDKRVPIDQDRRNRDTSD